MSSGIIVNMKLIKPTGLTATEEKKRIIKQQQEEAILDEMGQESEDKAAKVVIEQGKQQEQEEKKQESITLEKLQHLTKYAFKPYKHHLVEIIANLIRDRDSIPKGWLWEAWSNDKGVGLTIVSYDNKKFVRAFAPVNIPQIDLKGVVALVLSAEETIYKKEQKQKSQTIIIPS